MMHAKTSLYMQGYRICATKMAEVVSSRKKIVQEIKCNYIGPADDWKQGRHADKDIRRE